MLTPNTRPMTGLRLQFVLFGLAVIVTAASGAYMRVELLTPESSPTAGALYGRLHDLHILWAYFGLCLPFPFALGGLVFYLRPIDMERRPLATSLRSDSRRAESGLLMAGAVCHTAAALVMTLAFFFDVGSRLGLLCVPLMTLSVLFYASCFGARAWRVPTIMRSVPFVAMCLSLLATLVWALPCAVAVLSGAASTDWNELSVVFAPMLEVGIFLIVAPSALALSWVLVTRAVAGMRLRKPNASATAMLGLGIVLLVLIVVATTAKLFLELGNVGSHLSDSYWTVGIAHGLFGGTLFVFLSWWMLPTHITRTIAWLLIGCGAVLLVASTFDLLLGMYGMPTSYFQYIPEFRTPHVSAGVAWLAFLALLLATLAMIARRRRAGIPIDDFS